MRRMDKNGTEGMEMVIRKKEEERSGRERAASMICSLSNCTLYSIGQARTSSNNTSNQQIDSAR